MESRGGAGGGATLLSLHSLSVAIAPATTLLDSANATLTEGVRVGLVGPNGCGKSTLLRLLARGEEAAGGGAAGESYVTVKSGRLDGPLAPGRREPGSVLLVEQDGLSWSSLFPGAGSEEELREMTLPDALDLALLDESGPAAEDAESWRQLSVAAGSLLGWSLAAYDRTPIGKLSPGSALRAYLAVALRRPGVRLLLLDEPTNHLDLPSILWLQRAIQASPAAVVVVSHDEAFLDAVANHVWEICWDTQGLAVSRAQYSAFKESKRRALEEQRRGHAKQQKRHKKLTTAAEKLRQKSKKGERKEASDHDLLQRDFRRNRAGRSGKKASVLEKARDSEERIEAVKERTPLRIRLEPLAANTDSAIMANAAELGFAAPVPGTGDGGSSGEIRLPLPPVSLRVDYGERVAVVGFNAVGKTTLLRTLMGELKPLGGKVSVGRDLRIGNLTQEYKWLPQDVSPRDYVASLTDLDTLASGCRVIGYGLTRHQAESPIRDLNPGARARLLLALFSLRRVNALVLDEPTNHLDEEAVAELAASLNTYEGTVLVVSHDRAFLGALGLTSTFFLSPEGFRRVESVDEVVADMSRAVDAVMARS